MYSSILLTIKIKFYVNNFFFQDTLLRIFPIIQRLLNILYKYISSTYQVYIFQNSQNKNLYRQFISFTNLSSRMINLVIMETHFLRSQI